ncbi:protein-methionine-sulfoxide reductase catalytic subunit MsrP [Kordiimonas sp. SCSIO 12610]|uniref:protein-methionine-sulfoxide reductase catalytic subunit MsrP n=1 Tax=Kordiimonas sp. SCSIO 12610 TaxID=2829597 RepID=UPI002108E3F8|nr:protein-methionine-sulfoxide reductase catalytic subunit MsrP [Kordiimonas sp. SCSIO 12610]UTW55793.1 protein-methionine-sulfoxide reductase catalytic subunit MsrP [Kordiimonas sp. SCSIO 12610]
MLFKKRNSWDETENAVTSESVYLNRRKFLGAAGLSIGSAAVGLSAVSNAQSERPLKELAYKTSEYSTDEKPTVEAAVTNYNNFYEFGTSKGEPARNAWRLKTTPWNVKVDGLVENPRDYAFEDLIDMNALEERIYRFRCVEAWSMVVPWIGIPLASIIKKLNPLGSAKYVRFETLADSAQMPGIRWPVLEWPYVEGLRMDEAMNPLALMVVGLYGKEIPNQNGAPMRLITPWKYGYKSIKSIARITFTEEQPVSSWTKSAPHEYGFFSNVNPEVSHPRWSQASERKIGSFGRVPTQKFNGYGELVADMYAGMDLRVNH